MTYRTQAAMAQDPALHARIAACAAREGITDPHPLAWASDHQWRLAAEPGWDEAYAYAIASGVPDPGGSEGVVTDGMILSAVQALIPPHG